MPTSKKPSIATDTFNLADLNQLAEWLSKSALEEVEIEHAGTRIRLRKPGSAVAVAAPVAAAAATLPVQGAVQTATTEAANTFKSPMVGTFYRASSPEASPFVKEGDTVSTGQTLCIIEAMKTMNQIEADRAGTVRKVLVNNAHPVEFGQPLFVIE